MYKCKFQFISDTGDMYRAGQTISEFEWLSLSIADRLFFELTEHLQLK